MLDSFPPHLQLSLTSHFTMKQLISAKVSKCHVTDTIFNRFSLLQENYVFKPGPDIKIVLTTGIIIAM